MTEYVMVFFTTHYMTMTFTGNNVMVIIIYLMGTYDSHYWKFNGLNFIHYMAMKVWQTL